MVEIKVGDFVVDRGSYSACVYEVTRVTEKCFWHIDGWSKKPTRKDSSSIVFVGSKERADLLCQQLQSSSAQLTQEKSAAFDRKKKRDEAFIAAASAAVS